MKPLAFFALIASLAALATAQANGGPKFDPSGAQNVGNGQRLQFIGGQCLGAADCASGCCAGPSGICSGPGAQTQNGKTGCGFAGAATPPGSSGASKAAADSGNMNVAMASTGAASPAPQGATSVPASGGPSFDPEGAKNVGNGRQAQFIGGQCLGAADCASGCCAGPSGICSGVGAQTQKGKTGCGFESGKKLVRF